jgi:hypothetical protein
MQPQEKPQRSLRDVCVGVGFVLFLIAPAVDFALREGQVPRSFQENRRPAEMPAMPARAAEWSRWPAAFEAWHNDHFGLRTQFMRAHNVLKVFALRSSPSSRVVIGPNNWLFAATERSIENWRGADPLEIAELEAWRRCLESRQRALAERGIAYIFALAPSKPEIYPEQLPARYHKGGPSRVDQLVQYMAEHSSFQIVDLRAALLEEKRKDRGDDFTYFPLGTHWTARGAMAGLRGLIPELSRLLPAVAAVDNSNTSEERLDLQADSWAARLYLEDLLRQQVRAMSFAGESARELQSSKQGTGQNVVTDQADASLPRALVFHDSFGEALIALLGRHFSHALFVWKPEIDVALLESERPDVVLHVFNDRVLVTLTPQEFDAASRPRIIADYQAATQVALKLDCARNLPAIEALHAAVVSVRTETQAAVVACQMEHGGATVRLPEFQVRAAQRAIVRLEFESPISGSAVIFFQTRAQPSFSRSRQYQHEIHAGVNELYVELIDPDFNGKLLFKPSGEAGTFLIRALEARLVSR